MTTSHTRCGDVAFGHLCTARPGVVTDTGEHIYLCPPERDCVDVVVHRTAAHGWLTSAGTTPQQWFAAHAVRGDAGAATAAYALALCLAALVGSCLLVLTGHEPRLGGLALIGIPVLAVVAVLLARGRRWA